MAPYFLALPFSQSFGLYSLEFPCHPLSRVLQTFALALSQPKTSDLTFVLWVAGLWSWAVVVPAVIGKPSGSCVPCEHSSVQRL